MPQRDRSEVNARLLARERPGTEALEAARTLGGVRAAVVLATKHPQDAFGWMWDHSRAHVYRVVQERVARRTSFLGVEDEDAVVVGLEEELLAQLRLVERPGGHESDRRFRLLRLAQLALGAAAALHVAPEREVEPPP